MDATNTNSDDEGILIVTRVIVAYHAFKKANRIERLPCRTSTNTGLVWITDVLNGHPLRWFETFRMRKDVLRSLCVALRDKYKLVESRNICLTSMVAMFLYILTLGASNRDVQERFQHSGETVSRLFEQVMDSMCLMIAGIIKPRDTQFTNVSAKIKNDSRYWPNLKNCIGAIDGTHISVNVSKEVMLPYVGRKGVTTQNVMAVCDFDMLYTFVMTGWEGSMHDMKILQETLHDETVLFPKPPPGKYYLVDSRYSNRTGYLAPYRGERYYLQQFQGGRRASIPHEIFNQAHSSLRSGIERTFGVTKKKWKILDRMPSYDIKMQSKIIIACMTLHNFIRLSGLFDDDMSEISENSSGSSIGEVHNEDKDLGFNLLPSDDSEDMTIERDRIC